MPTRNVAIMFTDIKGFTERVAKGSRADVVNLREVHDSLLLPVVRHFDGRLVKTIGDALLVRFDSPTDAVLCGVTMLEVLDRHNANQARDEDRINVRVAINSGEVQLTDKDVLGEPVNIAARLEGVAEAGEVYFTESVYLSMNRAEAPSSEVGERTFKGVDYPVRVYKVIQDPKSDLARRLAEGVRLTDKGPVLGAQLRRPRAKNRMAIVLVGLLILALLAGAAYSLQPTPGETAIEQARIAADKGETLRAYQMILAAAEDHPGDKVASEFGPLIDEYAAAVLVDMAARSSHREAYAWLKGEIERTPATAVLVDDIPLYEARALAEEVIAVGDASDNLWPMVQPFAERYATNTPVLRELASRLEGKVYPYVPIRLNRVILMAGDRSFDDAIFAYCERLSTRGTNLGQHELMRDHFKERSVEWSRQQIKTSGNALVLWIAWDFLEKEDDPLVRDPYHVAVHEVLLRRGFQEEEAADESLAYFLSLESPERRAHAMAFHNWLTGEFGHKWMAFHRDLVKRNRDKLAEAWGEDTSNE